VPDLEAHPVDPRDQRWEVWNPTYRVHFWRPLGDGHSAREFEIAAGDVEEALAWVGEHRDVEETFALFAVVSRDDDLGLVRLAGTDPTRNA
jgi:hypothetical protein